MTIAVLRRIFGSKHNRLTVYKSRRTTMRCWALWHQNQIITLLWEDDFIKEAK